MCLQVIASLAAFAAYAADKSAAKRGRWRIPERTLLLLGLVGGWPGAWAAQKLLHHKSGKFSFQILFWATVIINCALLTWLFTAKALLFPLSG
jgi:uncharacterized membrane protein YsdA (DUF1294 family)